jgi:hypothetical protein
VSTETIRRRQTDQARLPFAMNEMQYGSALYPPGDPARIDASGVRTDTDQICPAHFVGTRRNALRRTNLGALQCFGLIAVVDMDATHDRVGMHAGRFSRTARGKPVEPPVAHLRNTDDSGAQTAPHDHALMPYTCDTADRNGSSGTAS